MESIGEEYTIPILNPWKKKHHCAGIMTWDQNGKKMSNFLDSGKYEEIDWKCGFWRFPG